MFLCKNKKLLQGIGCLYKYEKYFLDIGVVKELKKYSVNAREMLVDIGRMSVSIDLYLKYGKLEPS